MKIIGTESKRSRWSPWVNRFWLLYHAPKARAYFFHSSVLLLILLGAVSQFLDA